MLPLCLPTRTTPLRVLCLGAHADDIEIGCGGTLLRWVGEQPDIEVVWAVFCTDAARAEEARHSARQMLAGAARADVHLGHLRDSLLPMQFEAAKAFAVRVRDAFSPDVVLTHRLEDRHQDHRLVAEVTWQTWRDHLVLEYEIPKYEGDLGQPNLFVPLSVTAVDRKINHLMQCFASQRSKDWFSPETFRALMRLRGVECRSDSGFAEAFHVRKAIL